MRLSGLTLLLEFSVRNIERGINSWREAFAFIQNHPLRQRGGSDHNKAKLPSAKTFLVRDEEDGSISVFYHDTAVLTYHEDGAVTLNTGGWDTASTRNLINGYLPHHVRLYRDRSANWIIIKGNEPAVQGGYDYDWKRKAHKWTSRMAVITPDGHFIEQGGMTRQ